MINSGPIIVLEDDIDDLDMLRDAMKELEIPNQTIAFDSTTEAMVYLYKVDSQPFLILCDINLPGQTGLEFKKELDADPMLRKKSIPFIFYSTAADQKAIDLAFMELSVQGFFRKGDSFGEIKATLKVILEYWVLCRHPKA